MKRFVLVIGVLVSTLAVGVGSAAAFTGGGVSPSQAPLLTWGQHYEAALGNSNAEANYKPSCCSDDQVAIYRLGPLNVHDQVVVNWHALPFSHSSGFPVRMALVENPTDYTWGGILEHEVTAHELTGSGTARTEITVQNSSAEDFLFFFSRAEATGQDIESFLYDFTVEAPRHYLSLSLGSVSKVASNGYLHATATLATGAPVPDGYPVTLTGTWSGGGVFTITATSVAGGVTFPLAMPESSFGKAVEFVASGAATAEYQAATSSKVYAEITKPPAPPAPPKPPKTPKPVDLCKKATNKAHTLARMYKRQLRSAARVRGRHRSLLLRKARSTERKFLAARSAKKAAC